MFKSKFDFEIFLSSTNSLKSKIRLTEFFLSSTTTLKFINKPFISSILNLKCTNAFFSFQEHITFLWFLFHSFHYLYNVSFSTPTYITFYSFSHLLRRVYQNSHPLTYLPTHKNFLVTTMYCNANFHYLQQSKPILLSFSHRH